MNLVEKCRKYTNIRPPSTSSAGIPGTKAPETKMRSEMDALVEVEVITMVK